jgi:hypothetical protein
MKKLVKKIHKSTLELSKVVATKEFGDLTEDDVDSLAECINILEDLYEVLYDNVYDDSKYDDSK